MRVRNYIVVGIFSLLVAATLLILWEPWNTVQREGRKLPLQESSSIDKILIFDAYDSVRLEKVEKQWLLKGSEPLNQVVVENLLYAAGKIQVGSVHSDFPELDPGLVRSVQFIHKDKVTLQYEVYATESSFLVRPHGSQLLYSVTLPGYAGLDLTRVFSNRENHYREHMLIDLLPSEIHFVEVTRREEAPFRFTMDEVGGISCSFPLSDSVVPTKMLDELSIRLLFSYFTAIRYKERAEAGLRDAGSEVDPHRWLATLYVESRTGEKHSLKVYSLPGEGGSENHMFEALVFHNDDPGRLVVNFIYLDVLMRDLDSYLALTDG